MMTVLHLLTVALLTLLANRSSASCPEQGEPPANHPPVRRLLVSTPTDASTFEAAVEAIDWNAVKQDLRTLFSTSNPAWPNDYNHYGPFMIRLAWHCAGSYRTSDGRGGCRGGRIRFDPERSWDDNTNLEKAVKLLEPIKYKYGAGLSWGDLIILAGNEAISSMGGPVLGFCAGRKDDVDGAWSMALGAGPSGESTAEQKDLFPCGDAQNSDQGLCKTETGLGAGTVGLIYVNPAGPMGNGNATDSAQDIRQVFARMAMNDRETLSLIGGGHAFGKVHGPCPNGAGAAPKDDALNPWPGNCGTGKGNDAFTSGFEGPWTTTPTTWNNEYWQSLLNIEWEQVPGPAGNDQWQIKDAGVRSSMQAPAAHGPGTVPLMMLTSDIALTKDPAYLAIVQEFATDISALEDAFSKSWYKLTTRDMGPRERCLGSDVPAAQPWQAALPARQMQLADFQEVASELRAIIAGNDAVTAKMIRLAWQCGNTFRVTDYLGGCNGARIRHLPMKDFPENSGLDSVLSLLQPTKDKHGERLSWADLIVLAGQVAIEGAGGMEMPFCGGRTDAADASESDEYLKSRVLGHSNVRLSVFKDWYKVMGLSHEEIVALMLANSLGRLNSGMGYEGSWTSSSTISNEFFKILASDETWEKRSNSDGMATYKAQGKDVYILEADKLMLDDPTLSAIVARYAEDNQIFLTAFAAAWTKLMEADRFAGPMRSLCTPENTIMLTANIPTESPTSESTTESTGAVQSDEDDSDDDNLQSTKKAAKAAMQLSIATLVLVSVLLLCFLCAAIKMAMRSKDQFSGVTSALPQQAKQVESGAGQGPGQGP